MEITVRLEQKEDYREVESLTREAFWDEETAKREGVGCCEHYLAHLMREDPAFVPELDFVAVVKGQMVLTLDETNPDEGYRRTRAFYQAMGFLQLACFPQVWNEQNPCLVLVKPLGQTNFPQNQTRM